MFTDFLPRFECCFLVTYFHGDPCDGGGGESIVRLDQLYQFVVQELPRLGHVHLSIQVRRNLINYNNTNHIINTEDQDWVAQKSIQS